MDLYQLDTTRCSYNDFPYFKNSSSPSPFKCNWDPCTLTRGDWKIKRVPFALTSNVQRSSVQLHSHARPAVPINRTEPHETNDKLLLKIFSLHAGVIFVSRDDLESGVRQKSVIPVYFSFGDRCFMLSYSMHAYPIVF